MYGQGSLGVYLLDAFIAYHAARHAETWARGVPCAYLICRTRWIVRDVLIKEHRAYMEDRDRPSGLLSLIVTLKDKTPVRWV